MRKRIPALLLALVMALLAVPALAATGATSIAFDNYSVVLTPGSSHTLKVTISPSDVKASDLVWSSDDTRVATVSNGTIYTKVNGGCIITATDPHSGVSAKCYVGVGAPYGYVYYSPYDYYYNPINNPNYYYNSNYPYYNYNYNNSSNAVATFIVPNNNYPYGDYSYYPYNYYGYPYASSGYPTYYDYNNLNGYIPYVNPYGQIVYSKTVPNPTSYVAPGTSSTSSQFALEVKQGIEVRCNDVVKGFGYVDAGNRLIVIPDSTSRDLTNYLQLQGNVLSRLNRFKYEAVQYNLPNLEIGLFPALNKTAPTVLKVTGDTDTALEKAIHGPWKIDVNSDAKGLQLRFILDKQYDRSNLQLMMLDSKGKYVEVRRDQWTFTAQRSNDYTIYAIVTELLPAGTYAITVK